MIVLLYFVLYRQIINWIMCRGFMTRLQIFALENETLFRKEGGGLNPEVCLLHMFAGLSCEREVGLFSSSRAEGRRHKEQKSDYIEDDQLNNLCHPKIKWICLWDDKFLILFKQRLNGYLLTMLLRISVVENCVNCVLGELGDETPPHLRVMVAPVFLFFSLCLHQLCSFSFQEPNRNRGLSYGDFRSLKL